MPARRTSKRRGGGCIAAWPSGTVCDTSTASIETNTAPGSTSCCSDAYFSAAEAMPSLSRRERQTSAQPENCQSSCERWVLGCWFEADCDRVETQSPKHARRRSAATIRLMWFSSQQRQQVRTTCLPLHPDPHVAVSANISKR